MSDIAIHCVGLSKQYRIGERESYKALRDVITNAAASPFRRARAALSNGNGAATRNSKLETQNSFWALDDVSFEVKRGEVIGIIGRNGAGKSTLLKILSRITKPTKGHATIHGRVGSLLEVGTGFHPELTGRENIYLNAAILGMRKAEVEKKFDEIVAFAEVEKFIDTPVKRYSSGMYVRLAFAVAAHMETEVLLVDEVLAVGDAQFQKKCLGKMGDVSRAGRTVLFVSHDLSSIQALCSRAVYLAGGKVAGVGEVDYQIESYLRDCEQQRSVTPGNNLRLTEHLELQSFSFSPNPVTSGSPVAFEIQFCSRERVRLDELAILIYTSHGKRGAILDLRDSDASGHLADSGTARIVGNIKALPLVEGDYRVGLYINCGDVRRDYYDLVTLTVASPAEPGQIVPYPALNRGIVELDFDFTNSI
jgi:lipopolysaccharide transport system ATP-binding protein